MIAPMITHRRIRGGRPSRETRVGILTRCAIGPMYVSAAPGSVLSGKGEWAYPPRAHFFDPLAGPRLLRCLTTKGPALFLVPLPRTIIRRSITSPDGPVRRPRASGRCRTSVLQTFRVSGGQGTPEHRRHAAIGAGNAEPCWKAGRDASRSAASASVDPSATGPDLPHPRQ